jgi:hypothetical protein
MWYSLGIHGTPIVVLLKGAAAPVTTAVRTGIVRVRLPPAGLGIVMVVEVAPGTIDAVTVPVPPGKGLAIVTVVGPVALRTVKVIGLPPRGLAIVTVLLGTVIATLAVVVPLAVVVTVPTLKGCVKFPSKSVVTGKDSIAGDSDTGSVSGHRGVPNSAEVTV